MHAPGHPEYLSAQALAHFAVHGETDADRFLAHKRCIEACRRIAFALDPSDGYRERSEALADSLMDAA